MYKQNSKKWYWMLVLLVGFSGPAFGQVEINQSNANAGNVTPGDAPGFPITLSQPGNYRLTGNLNVPRNVTAIEVTADNVSIDLGNFIIRGPVSCTGNGESLSCSPSSSGVGIHSLDVSGTVVRNGEVRGMGIGLVLGTSGTTAEGANRAENVRVRFNFAGGMIMLSGIVTGCIIEDNDGDGLFIDSGIVRDNVVMGNSFAGIAVGGFGGVVLNNTASRNGAHGFSFAGTPPAVGFGNTVLSRKGF